MKREPTKIKYIAGDATNPKGEWPLIVHVCNNVGAWGAGFVIPLGKRYPKVEKAYKVLAWATAPAMLTLGTVQFVRDKKVMVANMIAQDNIIRKNRRLRIPLQYDALETCLEAVASQILKSPVKREVHMPRIGCGLAGGTWSKVEAVIVRTLCDKGIPVTVYDVPATNANYVKPNLK